MKCCLIVFLFISFSSLTQQEFGASSIQPISFPKQFKQQTIQTKKRFLRKEYKDPNSILFNARTTFKYFNDFYTYYYPFLYVHDFDLDKELDLLFFGPNQADTNKRNVILFLKEKRKYSPMSLGFSLIDMDLSKKKTVLKILNPPNTSDAIQLQYLEYESTEGMQNGLFQNVNFTFSLDRFKDNPPVSFDSSFTCTTSIKLIARPDFSEIERNYLNSVQVNIEMGELIPNVNYRITHKVIFEGKTWYCITARTGTEIKLNENWNNMDFGQITSARGWFYFD